MFCGFLTIGVPLPVLPLHVHGTLGFGTAMAGLAIGIQSFATILTRPVAGRMVDRDGAKATLRSRPRDLRRCWRRLSPVPHARAALDGPRGAVGRSPGARGRRKPADHGRSQLGHHPRRHGTLRSRHGLERHGPIFGPGRRSATRLRAVPGSWVRRGGVERDTASRSGAPRGGSTRSRAGPRRPPTAAAKRRQASSGCPAWP